MCPTICDLGPLGQVAGIAFVPGVPGLLLVNRLICKPACSLGASLIEPHKKSLFFGTLCTPKLRSPCPQ